MKTMETLYRKVAVSERLPDTLEMIFTDEGSAHFRKGEFLDYTGVDCKPTWWLEEIPATIKSDQTKIQPTEIEQLMKEKLADRKIDDEFGWTGEWRMSAKNVLDLIIDLQNNQKLQNHNYIMDGCASLMMLVTGHELNLYQRGDARQELDKLLSDKKNALQQIEKLEAEKKELVEALEGLYNSIERLPDIEYVVYGKQIESLIQKMKK